MPSLCFSVIYIFRFYFNFLELRPRQHMVHAEFPHSSEQCPFCENSAVPFVLWRKYFQGEMTAERAKFLKLNRIHFKRR